MWLLSILNIFGVLLCVQVVLGILECFYAVARSSQDT